MKIDIAHPATRFFALSAIALTLSAAPSRADWTTVRPDGSTVTTSTKTSRSSNGSDRGPDSVQNVDAYDSDTFDGPSAAPPSSDGRSRRRGDRDDKGNRGGRRGNGTQRSDTSISVGVYGYPGGYAQPGFGGYSYPQQGFGYPQQGYGYVQPGYGFGAPQGYVQPGFGAPYGYGYSGYPGGVTTIITTPTYATQDVPFPGFRPIPGSPQATTAYVGPPTVIYSYPGVPYQSQPFGFPNGYPQGYGYGFPNGTSTQSYGGVSISRGGVGISVGGSRTTTQSTFSNGTHRRRR